MLAAPMNPVSDQPPPTDPAALPRVAEPGAVGLHDPAAAAVPWWFCVRTQPKHEHIAAAHLRRLELPGVFCPRLRCQRATRRGPVWMVDALFPGYLFARFVLREHLPLVASAPSVKYVLRFGDRWPVVPARQVAELRAAMRGKEVAELPPAFEPGDEVQIASGPFFGLSAVVQRYLPSRERVRVLLEFLGRTTEAEIGTDQLRPARKTPPELASEAEIDWDEAIDLTGDGGDP